MKLFDGCLLACDIDGTLIANGVIPQENIEKIKFFVENGGIFSLATGRSAGAVSDVTSKIDCVGASVVSNGCMIYDYINKTVLFEAYIDDADAKIMLDVKRDYPNIGIELHSGVDVFVLNRTGETDDHEAYESLPSDIISEEKSKKLKYNKILYATNNIEERQILKNKLEKYGSNCDFLDTSAVVYGRKRYYLEQIPKGASKAVGVMKLKKLLNIKDDCLFAIGDYYNDLPMIKSADISASPIDSPEDVKVYATYITKPAENGAVADFIDYLTELRRK